MDEGGIKERKRERLNPSEMVSGGASGGLCDVCLRKAHLYCC